MPSSTSTSATGRLDTGFYWFLCVYKQTLRRFPKSQVATTCFSCSPPDLNLLVTNFKFRNSVFLLPAYAVYEDGTVFRNVGKYNSNAGKSPKIKNTTFRILRKFEIKKHGLLLHRHSQFVHHGNSNTLFLIRIGPCIILIFE